MGVVVGHLNLSTQEAGRSVISRPHWSTQGQPELNNETLSPNNRKGMYTEEPQTVNDG